MRLYLDTEFNGFGGALMSLALVPAAKDAPIFYRVVEGWSDGPIDPWVQQHVVPNLGAPQMPRERAGAELAAYLRLRNVSGRPTIVADWPTDFEHLLALLINGPGMMHPAPDFDMEYRRLPGFNTADHSRVPHNALEDAIALRNHCEATR
jgi:hypothetical protein